MNITTLKELCKNRIAYLEGQRDNALAVGDAETYTLIDNDILATKVTLSQLETIPIE